MGANNRFGRLIITDIIESIINDKKRKIAICNCDCGTSNKQVRLDGLKSGRVKSCGKCDERELINKKFGKWIVISTSYRGDKLYCSTKCECSNSGFVSANSLKQGKSKSCGKCIIVEAIGKKINKLIVKNVIYNNNKLKYELYCECDCGNTHTTGIENLSRLNSCGSCDEKGMIGFISGRLTVYDTFYRQVAYDNILENRLYCLCKCNCENSKNIEVSANAIKQTKTRSCGHCDEIDIIGKKFVFLTVASTFYKQIKNGKKNINALFCMCKCKCGEIKIIRANDLKTGHTYSCGCLKHVSELELKNTLRQIFPRLKIMSGYRKFDWLRNDSTDYPLELDIYIPELKLAIEYDGEQHFGPIRFGGISEIEAKSNYTKQKKRDKLKNKLIEQHKEDVRYFIRFNYEENITKEYVISKLVKYGIIK